MSIDKVEERKEKLKPAKLFSFTCIIYDDGTMAGYGLEYRNMGRLKNRKLIIPAKEDFISSVRSIVPSAIPVIESLVDQVYEDLGDEDSGPEKFASVNIDIYNDSFVAVDFSEYMENTGRGPAKAWRQLPNDFMRTIQNRFGNLVNPLKPLLNAGPVIPSCPLVDGDSE